MRNKFFRAAPVRQGASAAGSYRRQPDARIDLRHRAGLCSGGAALLPDAARFSGGSGAFDPRANNVGTDVARILLADDNSDMRAFIRRLLETRCRVQIVTDGEA